jgi:small subunit ribosomal protein S6
MVRDYELMYIVRPDLDEEALATAIASVETLVGGQGGEVVSTTHWGKRRLAYEIDKLRDGYYVILHVRLDTTKVRDVERLLKISDTVFRHMVTAWVPEPETPAGRAADAAAAAALPDGEPVPEAELEDEPIDDADLDAEPDETLVGATPAPGLNDEEKS